VGTKVGIEQMGIYWPSCCVKSETLAQVRGQDPQKITLGLGIDSFVVPAPFEDAVTMAANAAQHLFENWQGERSTIGRIVVATESALDCAKPIAAYLHALLGLPPHCEAFDVKFACVAGTYALLDALRYVRATGRRALVIMSDIALYGPASGSAEFTQGAGAAALLVSTNPLLAAINPDDTGTFTQDQDDFYRPVGHAEAVVNGKHSVECYLRSLAALDDYAHNTGAELFNPSSRKGAIWAMLFHVPYPGLPKKALNQVAVNYPRAHSNLDSMQELLQESLAIGRRIGNAYTASLYLCLAALIAAKGAQAVGRKIGLYSYGSGSGAKFMVASVGPGAATHSAHIKRAVEQLPELRNLSLEEYESMMFRHLVPANITFDHQHGFRLASTDPTGYRRYAAYNTEIHLD